jgi:isopentenyldiphosphate isomerase
MADDPEELLDLIDDKDVVIGQKSRTNIYAEGLKNFRVVNVFLRNSEGRLWIPRRTAHKTLFPLHLDMSAAGHVASGETYDDAFKRETQEELNIDVDAVPWKMLGKASPRDGLSAFQQVYEVISDRDPDFNLDDFVEGYWLTPRELIGLVENGDPAKSDLPKLVRMFFKL